MVLPDPKVIGEHDLLLDTSSGSETGRHRLS
jgi:hypothetical protein